MSRWTLKGSIKTLEENSVVDNINNTYNVHDKRVAITNEWPPDRDHARASLTIQPQLLESIEISWDRPPKTFLLLSDMFARYVRAGRIRHTAVARSQSSVCAHYSVTFLP